MSTRVRPLLVRPGARFECHGDGLCCTDVHRLGPIDEREARALVPASALVRDPHLDTLVMKTDANGCTQLGDSGCELHRVGGPLAKPTPCRRFPYELVGTPSGGRVATYHRCPCRTMGERRPIDQQDAASSLGDARGRLVATRRVDEVRLSRRRKVPFSRYQTIEDAILTRLDGREPIRSVLDAEPLPELDGLRYEDLALHLMHPPEETDATRATAMAGEMLAVLVGVRGRASFVRFGAASFDRAERRSATVRSPDAILRDFVADSIWSLRWTEDLDFARCRADLATRVALAEGIASRLARARVRRDRAMAEAVTAVESLGVSASWRWAMARAVVR